MKRKNGANLMVLIICVMESCTQSKSIQSDWALLPFIKIDSVNPILLPASTDFFCPIRKQRIKWEEKDVFNPTAVIRHDTVFMLYRAEDVIGKFAGTSRIGLAYSLDGIHFIRETNPILFPDEDFMKIYEWEGGIEDPRIIESQDGVYYLTYTAYDANLARLCLASSTDLRHWKKNGLML